MDQSLYESDILAWSEQQAAALRGLIERRHELSNELDLENIAEEIESLGRSELASVQSLIRQLLVHLIKAASVDDQALLSHWLTESLTFQGDALERVSPSMLAKIDLRSLWKRAGREAGAALALHDQTVPVALLDQCPLSLSEILDPQFDFQKAVAKAKARTLDTV